MILPTQDYRRTHLETPDRLHQGLDALVHGLAGWHRRATVGRSLTRETEEIRRMADGLVHLSDRRLRDRLAEAQTHFRRQAAGFEESLPEALACMMEAASRTLGLRPYPVQIMGALALYRGYLAEMATGEGKSLTACLPSVLAAWTGRPFHFVTVNDYLADRDAVEMNPFYEFCGVSVGCVTGPHGPQGDGRLNYDKGVVYTTFKELVCGLCCGTD